jgi:hypothetical protein
LRLPPSIFEGWLRNLVVIIDVQNGYPVLWRQAYWSIDLPQPLLSYAYVSHLRQFASESNALTFWTAMAEYKDYVRMTRLGRKNQKGNVSIHD